MHRHAIACAFALCLWGCSAEPAAPPGEALFKSQGCTLCHGPDGAGTAFGPSLVGKKGFWTREKLVEYLKNPGEYVPTDKRLSAQAKKYTLPMQRFDKLKPEELSALADYLLSMP